MPAPQLWSGRAGPDHAISTRLHPPLAPELPLSATARDFWALLNLRGVSLVVFTGLVALIAASGRIHATLGFAGVLGIGVIGLAIWRSFQADLSGAALMGRIGAVALVVNVASALILSLFRDGDAKVRAIWLFIRTDTIASIVVIIASALVAWTRQAWPDVAAAGVIALLFLYSAYEIVRNALGELSDPRGQAVA